MHIYAIIPKKTISKIWARSLFYSDNRQPNIIRWVDTSLLMRTQIWKSRDYTFSRQIGQILGFKDKLASFNKLFVKTVRTNIKKTTSSPAVLKLTSNQMVHAKII